MAGLDNYWLQRVHRRGVLQGGGALGLGLASAALVACSGGNKSTPPSGAAAPASSVARSGTAGPAGTAAARAGTATANRYGGTVNEGWAYRNDLWDPLRTSFGVMHFYGSISSWLMNQTPVQMDLSPMLIEAWEEVQVGTEYVLHARKNAVWENKAPTNGRPWDAQDIIYNLRYAAGLETPNDAATLAHASWYFGINTAEATDSKTVKLTFSKPNAAILPVMADVRQVVIPREVPGSLPFTQYANIPSIGPFLVKEWKEGEHATFVRNPNYWEVNQDNDKLPYIDGSTFQWYGDTASQFAAMLAGAIDQIFIIDVPYLQQLQKDNRFAVYEYPNRGYSALFINAKRYPDPRVWQALNIFFDHQKINDALYGQGKWEWAGPFCPAFSNVRKGNDITSLPGFNPKTRDADIANGKQLLAAAGFPNGKGLKMDCLTGVTSGAAGFDVVVRYQADLKTIVPEFAFNAVPSPDPTSYQKSLQAKDYDATSYGILEGPDVRIAALSYQTGNSRNFTNYSNPVVDGLIDKIYGQNGEAFNASIRAIEDELLSKGSPAINYASQHTSYVAPKRFQGMDRLVGPGAHLQMTERKDIWLTKA